MNNLTIDYTAKSFAELRTELDNYAKTYYPNTYQDFSAEEPGAMVLDLVALTGDMLSFYGEKQLSESRLMTAQDVPNLLLIAQQMGYRPHVTTPAVAPLLVMQQVPSLLVSGSYVPDLSYAVKIPRFTAIRSLDNGTQFLLDKDVDFAVNIPSDRLTSRVYTKDNQNNPLRYLLIKEATAFSGTIKSLTQSISSTEPFRLVTVTDDRIIGIVSVLDNAGNQWVEVPVLGENSVWDTVLTSSDSLLLSDAVMTPRKLIRKAAPRRFTSRFISSNELQLEFGSGTALTPIDPTSNPWTPAKALTSDQYGKAPAPTSLTIQYMVGGGSNANVKSYSLNSIDVSGISVVSGSLQSEIRNSITIQNPEPATGGGDGDTIESIRTGALLAASRTNRAVSTFDYERIVQGLPPTLGAVRSVYAETEPNDPATMYLYIASQDANGYPSAPGVALVYNITQYLEEYRLANHRLVLRSAVAIPIGIDVTLSARRHKTDGSIISTVINTIIAYFTAFPTQIGAGINLGEIISRIDELPSVETVHGVDIRGLDSTIQYDLSAARIDNWLYPSLDPSIFYIPNPQTDIRVRIT